jgi:hypothetical protein
MVTDAVRQLNRSLDLRRMNKVIVLLALLVAAISSHAQWVGGGLFSTGSS